jgi:hypothetical protein
MESKMKFQVVNTNTSDVLGEFESLDESVSFVEKLILSEQNNVAVPITIRSSKQD